MNYLMGHNLLKAILTLQSEAICTYTHYVSKFSFAHAK